MNTREEWLNAALVLVRAHLAQTSQAVVPDNVRVSCGFPGGSGAGLKAIGQCWPSSLSQDSTIEIFISPVLDDKKPMDVLGCLVHEAVHAAVGNEHGHKAPFKRVAVLAGLQGKMTATVPSASLCEIMQGWYVELGAYPHGALNMADRKKAGTRLIKCECAQCGYVVRTTAKWIAVGPPLCPACTDEDGRHIQMIAHTTESEDNS